MKSRDRCRAQYQGDRCKLAEFHDGNHASAFHVWGKGTNGKVITLPESDVPRIMRKLARSNK